MPIPIPDEQALRAAVLAMENAPDTTGRARSRAALAARARVMGLQHLVPAGWQRPRRRDDPADMRASAAAAAAARAFDCKAHGCGLPASALQEAYMRAVRQWALLPDDMRPPAPIDREAYAQARVNSLVRRALSDPTVRSDADDDLITAPPTRSAP